MRIVRRSFVVMSIAAMAAVVAGPIPLASAVVPTARTSIHPGKIGIGDSVMLGAKDELRARGFARVDAVVSRQFYSADDTINYWKHRGLLPKRVIVHLGNNGLIHGSDCDAAVRAAGTSRIIYFVNLKIPRPHRDPSNKALRACASRHSNAHVIDWYSYSRHHDSWFYHDGYHLTPTGQIAYASFVASHSG
jgi:hypothetical protein